MGRGVGVRYQVLVGRLRGQKFGNSLKFGASFSSVLAVIPQGRAYVMYVLCDVSA